MTSTQYAYRVSYLDWGGEETPLLFTLDYTKATACFNSWMDAQLETGCLTDIYLEKVQLDTPEADWEQVARCHTNGWVTCYNSSQG